jgi:hypothetical protein
MSTKPITMKFSVLFLFAFSISQAQIIQSPSVKLMLILNYHGQPSYSVNYKDKAVILESTLGIKLKEKQL